MKLVFKPQGKINQNFLENSVPIYKEKGLIGHTGIDWKNGFGKPVFCQNDCFVYKVIKPGDLPSNWSAVYTIAEGGGELMEICYGHLSSSVVSEGEVLAAGQLVGYEGNFGDVFSGGVRITPEMQRAGDTRGSHVHESWRPVVRRKFIEPGAHYLRRKNGSAYFNKSYFEIIYNNPQTNGFIDPLMYASGDTKVPIMKSVLSPLFALLEKLKNK